MKRLLIASLMGAFAFAASAQTTTTPIAADTSMQAQPAMAEGAAETEAKDKLSDSRCLSSTGSRIVAKPNEKGEKRCVAATGRVYTRDDLARTGEVDIADALRKLDPAID